jgi:hypothetical protein
MKLSGIVVTGTRAALFLHIHHFTIAGLRPYCLAVVGLFLTLGDCHVLFQESAMVKIKNAYKMKNELTIKKASQNSFSIKAAVKKFSIRF